MNHRIAVVGYGAIGQDLCAKLQAGPCEIIVLLAEGVPAPGAVPANVSFTHNRERLFEPKPGLLVEAAGQHVLKEFAPLALARGISVLGASVGVAGDGEFMASVANSVRSSSARLFFPTGAVGGIDYLNVVAADPHLKVTYTSRKPVAAWSGELAEMGHDPASVRGEIQIYEGDAVEAATLYPRNLNAGLTIALAAGVGRTKVRVVADPGVRLNTHEIEVDSTFGQAFMRFANRPSPDNPKTSAITAESLVVAVRQHFGGTTGTV